MHDLPIIKKADLVLDSKSKIGEGQFGTVYKAKWRGQTVAVKVLNSKSANLDSFYKEAQIMAKVGNHQNIVRLMGVCLDEDSVSIVSQFYPQGSCYKVFLKDRRDVTWLQLLKVAKGAAAGVMHLHAENYIHRDIASRNILISDSFEGVVTDFGMSRLQLREGSQTVTYLGPVKWMAPESLRDHVVSKATDVYMFGSFMWELITREIPYSDDDPLVAATRTMEQGCTLPVPDCPDAWRQLMVQCLRTNPDERPTFVEIQQRLEQMYEEEVESDSQKKAPISVPSARHSFSSSSASSFLSDSNPIIDLSGVYISSASSGSPFGGLPPPSPLNSSPRSGTSASSTRGPSPQRPRFSSGGSSDAGYVDTSKLPMGGRSGYVDTAASLSLLQTTQYQKKFSINSNGYLMTTTPYAANDYSISPPLGSVEVSPRNSGVVKPPFGAADNNSPYGTKPPQRRTSEGSPTGQSRPSGTTTLLSASSSIPSGPAPPLSLHSSTSNTPQPKSRPPSGKSFAISASSQDILHNTKESPLKTTITLYSDRVQHSPELLGWVPQASLEHTFKRPTLSRSGPANLTQHPPPSSPQEVVSHGRPSHHPMSSSTPTSVGHHPTPVPHYHGPINNYHGPPPGMYPPPFRGGRGGLGPQGFPHGYPPRGGLSYAPPNGGHMGPPLTHSSSGGSISAAPPSGYPPNYVPLNNSGLHPVYPPSGPVGPHGPTSPSTAPTAFGYPPPASYAPAPVGMAGGSSKYPPGYPPGTAPPLAAPNPYYPVNHAPSTHPMPTSLAASSSSLPPSTSPPAASATNSAAPVYHYPASQPKHSNSAGTHPSHPVLPSGPSYNKPLPSVPPANPPSVAAPSSGASAYAKPLPALPPRTPNAVPAKDAKEANRK